MLLRAHRLRLRAAAPRAAARGVAASAPQASAEPPPPPPSRPGGAPRAEPPLDAGAVTRALRGARELGGSGEATLPPGGIRAVLRSVTTREHAACLPAAMDAIVRLARSRIPATTGLEVLDAVCRLATDEHIRSPGLVAVAERALAIVATHGSAQADAQSPDTTQALKTMLRVYAAYGQGARARVLFSNALASGVWMNADAWNALIRACSHAVGDFEHALRAYAALALDEVGVSLFAIHRETIGACIFQRVAGVGGNFGSLLLRRAPAPSGGAQPSAPPGVDAAGSGGGGSGGCSVADLLPLLRDVVPQALLNPAVLARGVAAPGTPQPAQLARNGGNRSLSSERALNPAIWPAAPSEGLSDDDLAEEEALDRLLALVTALPMDSVPTRHVAYSAGVCLLVDLAGWDSGGRKFAHVWRQDVQFTRLVTTVSRSTLEDSIATHKLPMLMSMMTRIKLDGLERRATSSRLQQQQLLRVFGDDGAASAYDDAVGGANGGGSEASAQRAREPWAGGRSRDESDDAQDDTGGVEGTGLYAPATRARQSAGAAAPTAAEGALEREMRGLCGRVTDLRVDDAVNGRAVHVLRRVRIRIAALARAPVSGTPVAAALRSQLMARAGVVLHTMTELGVSPLPRTLAVFLQASVVSGDPSALQLALPLLIGASAPSVNAVELYSQALREVISPDTAPTILRMLPALNAFGVRPTTATLQWLCTVSAEQWGRGQLEAGRCPGCLRTGECAALSAGAGVCDSRGASASVVAPRASSSASSGGEGVAGPSAATLSVSRLVTAAGSGRLRASAAAFSSGSVQRFSSSARASHRSSASKVAQVAQQARCSSSGALQGAELLGGLAGGVPPLGMMGVSASSHAGAPSLAGGGEEEELPELDARPQPVATRRGRRTVFDSHGFDGDGSSGGGGGAGGGYSGSLNGALLGLTTAASITAAVAVTSGPMLRRSSSQTRLGGAPEGGGGGGGSGSGCGGGGSAAGTAGPVAESLQLVQAPAALRAVGFQRLTPLSSQQRWHTPGVHHSLRPVPPARGASDEVGAATTAGRAVPPPAAVAAPAASLAPRDGLGGTATAPQPQPALPQPALYMQTSPWLQLGAQPTGGAPVSQLPPPLAAALAAHIGRAPGPAGASLLARALRQPQGGDKGALFSSSRAALAAAAGAAPRTRAGIEAAAAAGSRGVSPSEQLHILAQAGLLNFEPPPPREGQLETRPGAARSASSASDDAQLGLALAPAPAQPPSASAAYGISESMLAALAMRAATLPCAREAWSVWATMRWLRMPAASNRTLLRSLLHAFLEGRLSVGAWEVFRVLYGSRPGPLPDEHTMRAVLAADMADGAREHAASAAAAWGAERRAGAPVGEGDETARRAAPGRSRHAPLRADGRGLLGGLVNSSVSLGTSTSASASVSASASKLRAVPDAAATGRKAGPPAAAPPPPSALEELLGAMPPGALAAVEDGDSLFGPPLASRVSVPPPAGAHADTLGARFSSVPGADDESLFAPRRPPTLAARSEPPPGVLGGWGSLLSALLGGGDAALRALDLEGERGLFGGGGGDSGRRGGGAGGVAAGGSALPPGWAGDNGDDDERDGLFAPRG